MKKIFGFMAAMALMIMPAATLTSCSSDDDEDNDGGSASSINNPLVKEGGLLLTSITCQFGYSGDIDYDTYRFFYDEKLRPYKCDNGDDDDAAYLQAMDFAAKFHQDLTEYQDDTAAPCNIDIFVVRPVLRNPGSDNPELYYLIMNDKPWTTNE